MGIDDRDYLRGERRVVSFGGGGGGQWAIKYILIANIAVFLLQQTTPLVTYWLDLRLPMQIDEDTAFLVLGTNERALFSQLDEDAFNELPQRKLEAGSRVFRISSYDNFSLVLHGTEYGLVNASAVSIAPTRFWELGWRLLTYGFCHDRSGLMHIAFNMFVLWMFGRAIEPILGSREFLAFYLSAIVVSGLCHLLVQAFHPVPVLGASGGVMGVVFLTAMYFPRMTVLLFFVIPVELRWVAVLYAVVDLAGMMSDKSTVAHAAHLGGAAFGVGYKYFGWRLIPYWDHLRNRLASRRPRTRPPVRIHRPSPDDVRARVDELLDKIHREGESSLTDEEREFLRDASRNYRGG